MTIIEQTLRDLLIQANVVDDRVFLIRAPQVPADKQKFPYVIFFHIAPSPHYEQAGPLQTLDRDYQISVFDTSQSRALAMADTIRQYLEGFRGDFELARFYAFFHRNQHQAWETDTKLYQIAQEYRVLYALLDAFQTSAVKPAVSTRSTRRSLIA